MASRQRGPRRLAWLRKQVREQRQWIEDHGATLAGYVARYGAGDAADHYGDGGEAIYAADRAALRQYERELALAELAHARNVAARECPLASRCPLARD